ncbi:hypothetical protein EJ08DRAFT_257757 [Tothia fuscella]|uniref:RPA43 OB domain-containing protein n=1 Tax=Tothia fuscella TaxID=1048955 RepID=A0A9P4TXW1_9PEZI|nr:hypothetical protein EJ08DRAFT_257757 [Tothia fuscella]
MSTEFSEAASKEQRKKEKERKKKELKKLEKRSSKKRPASGLEEESTEPTELQTNGHTSPSKRARTTEPDRATNPTIQSLSTIQVPDSQQQDLPIDSPFHGANASIRVSIPPAALGYPVEAICANYLSPMLLTWSAQLDGIVMAYNNVRLGSTSTPSMSKSQLQSRPQEADTNETEKEDTEEQEKTYATSTTEFAAPFLWVHAHFLLLRPTPNTYLTGTVNLQNPHSLSLILFNLFNVTILKKYLPKGEENRMSGGLSNGHGGAERNVTAGAESNDVASYSRKKSR